MNKNIIEIESSETLIRSVIENETSKSSFEIKTNGTITCSVSKKD